MAKEDLGKLGFRDQDVRVAPDADPPKEQRGWVAGVSLRGPRAATAPPQR
jgi:hypothetical protein